MGRGEMAMTDNRHPDVHCDVCGNSTRVWVRRAVRSVAGALGIWRALPRTDV